MVRKVLFTADGRELITVSWDKTIRVWDVASGETLRVLRPPIGVGLEGKINAAALSPDGRTLAVGGYYQPENSIHLISLATGRIERMLKGHTNVVLALAFAPDGRRLASVGFDHTARIWAVNDGRCEQVLPGTHERYLRSGLFSGQPTSSYGVRRHVWTDLVGGDGPARGGTSRA